MNKKMLLFNRLQAKAKNDFFKVLCYALFAALLLLSCDDFFEKDLEGKEVTIISPADTIRTLYSTIEFYWEEEDGALTYNLQIATPSFERVEQLVIDTNVSVTKFTYSLFPGEFQWRIRPENGSSKGNYVVRSFTIDSTLNLQGQKINLKSPGSDYATKDKSLLFSWGTLYNADKYFFEIRSTEWDKGETLLKGERGRGEDTITANIAAYKDGIYYWGVQGYNKNSITTFFSRKFYIDTKAPEAPQLSEPTDSLTISAWPSTFKWEDAADDGSPVYDSLVIATDRTFKTSSLKYTKRVDGKSLSVNLTDNGKYYWKVHTVDAAKNVSASSKIFRIIVGSVSPTTTSK